MARKVISMEQKLAAVFAAGFSSVPVTVLCAELGISRQTFYKYRRRWREEGPAGLVERSRAPKRSPQLMPAALEDEIVRLRKELPLDNGAQTIAYALAGQGRWDPVPSVSAIHRALRRRGMVVPEPSKRPRSAVKRFAWPRPNDAWQIDATRWALVDDTVVWIMDIIDDCSRLLVASQACTGPTSEAAWKAFTTGCARWGAPARVMSDNGTCFTARFSKLGGTAPFERDLAALGIRHILSSPGHPETCGKIERQHKTLKAWLARQDPARDLAELQKRLDGWTAFYNQRPHSSLDGTAPLDAWHSAPPARPGPPLAPDPASGLRLVEARGAIGWEGHIIGIGQAHAGETVLVTARGDDLAVFDATSGLIRRLTLDRTRHYQPTGRPRGRPKSQRPTV